MTDKVLHDFSQALNELKAMAAEISGLAEPLSELSSMKNFIDDELMMANLDFTNSVQEACNRVMACFESRFSESGTRQVLGDILLKEKLVSSEQLKAAAEKQKKIGAILVEQGALTETDLNKALHKQDQQTLTAHLSKSKAPEISKTIRIDQGRLDQFADAVGGLYISLDSVQYLKRQLEAAEVSSDLLERFDNTANGFDEKLKKLHASIMDIRRIPVRPLFQRFPKVIRQLADRLDKEILFNITGENTVVDKDLLEKIENPLVHILRNSVDHGFERPAEREAVNKSRQGTLSLGASVDADNLYLLIADDGRGIDPQQMKKVAVKKGFATAADVEALTDKELINLIFRPGFSSAEKVSDVSGRGVGMDVVLSALKECNGLIDVESKYGQGTTVSITIPLTKTLVTKDALLVKAGNEVFFIPSEAMTTILETEKDVIMMSSEKCFAYQDKALRLLDLNHFFGDLQDDKSHKVAQKIVVCAEYDVGVAVDKVLSHQKIVVKDFDQSVRELVNDMQGVSGYTIMGNDDIVLIVDVEKFAKQRRHSADK